MMDFGKRQFLEVYGEVSTTSYLDREYNNFRKVSHANFDHKNADFIKCPVNIGDWLKRESDKKAWKVFKIYVKYLDLKVQNPNCGTFQISSAHPSVRSYQRVINELIKKGWVSREGKTVYLRAYQFVWRDMGITQVRDKGILRFKYWKMPVSMFSDNRKNYIKEIEHEIRKKISKRKQAQMRYALKDMGNTQATFSSRSAGSLFGYKSPSSGTKLRSKYFEVIPMTPEEAKPKWNKERGRYEEPTRKIAIPL